MSFIKFEHVGAKLSNTISLTKSESFGFAAGFYKKYGISEFNFVTLFYDRDEGKIGFQFSKDKIGKTSFTLIHSKNKQSGSIIARSFFRTFDIDSKKYQGKYEPVEFTDPQHGQMFYIILLESK